VAIKDVPDQRRFVLARFEARLARMVRSGTAKSVRQCVGCDLAKDGSESRRIDSLADPRPFW
jgi:hypothetical protein